MTTFAHLFGISPNVLDVVGKSLVFALLLALAIGMQFANMGFVRFKTSSNGEKKTPAHDAPIHVPLIRHAFRIVSSITHCR